MGEDWRTDVARPHFALMWTARDYLEICDTPVPLELPVRLSVDRQPQAPAQSAARHGSDEEQRTERASLLQERHGSGLVSSARLPSA